MDTAYVIAWEYYDHSGYGVAAALPSEKAANDLLTLLQAASDGSSRQYSIHPVPTLQRLFAAPEPR